MLYSRLSLVVYFIHSINRVYMSIPISQFIPCSRYPFGFLYSFTSNRSSRHAVTSNHSLFTLLGHQRARSHFCFPPSQPGVEPAGQPFLMPVFQQHVSSVDFYFCSCRPFLKSLLNLLQYCFCFMVRFFGCKADQRSNPQPRH